MMIQCLRLASLVAFVSCEANAILKFQLASLRLVALALDSRQREFA
tara:strand:+ start:1049 stop:1186 length:138 start_codon:yes stop_codon:yes gene_type:complete